MAARPQRSAHFPYTPLFRSRVESDLKTISGKLDRIAAQAVDPSAIEKLHRRFEEASRQPPAEMARLEGSLKGIANKRALIATTGIDPTLVETLNRRMEDFSR